jgi:hypothetical protein
MKRYLIVVLILALMPFVGATSVSAATIESQSVDVVVGEVDRIGSDDEIIGKDSEQEVYDVPNTGLFGTGVDEMSAVVTASSTIVVAIILAWLFAHIRRKYKK